MKTYFKKAMKCFQKSIPGISYLTDKRYFVGGRGRARVVRRVCNKGFSSEGLCPEPANTLARNRLHSIARFLILCTLFSISPHVH